MRVEARAGRADIEFIGCRVATVHALSLGTHPRRFAGPTRPQDRRRPRFDLLRSGSDDVPRAGIRDPHRRIGRARARARAIPDSVARPSGRC